MCSQIGVGKSQPHDDFAVEEVDGDLGFPQLMENAGHGIAHANGVDQHAHRDAAFDRAGKRLDKKLAHSVVVENVGLEKHAFLRAVDRPAHRRISLVAGLEHSDRVSRGQRPPRHPVAERLQPDEALAVLSADQRLHGDVAIVPCLGGLASDGPQGAYRRAADAVDASDGVDDRAKEGRK